MQWVILSSQMLSVVLCTYFCEHVVLRKHCRKYTNKKKSWGWKNIYCICRWAEFSSLFIMHHLNMQRISCSANAEELSLSDQWLIYNAEETINPRFSAKKKHLLQSKALVHVTGCASGRDSCLGYDVEGSYLERSCVLLDEKRRQLAEIKRKESAQGVTLGLDVFCLIIEPGLDASFAMAMVILLEQMFGSRQSLCYDWMPS